MLRSQEGQAGSVLGAVLALLSKSGAGTREKVHHGLGHMKRDELLFRFFQFILTLSHDHRSTRHIADAF